MKRVLALALAMVMALSLAACGGSGGSRRARKGYERGAAALHFSGKHCRRGTQGQKVHKEVIKQKKLNVHVFCAAAPTEVQGLPPSLLAADGNGCARSVSA